MSIRAPRDRRTLLAMALIATVAIGCTRDEGRLSKADQSLLTERLSLLGDAVPVEAMVRAFEVYSEMGKKLGEEASSTPIAKADQERIASEWRRFSSAMRAPPAWNGDRPLTADERAKEKEHLWTMHDALGKIRALLAPHRAWVEDHFGRGVFGDV